MNILERHIVPDRVERTRLSDYAGGIFHAIPSRKGMKKAIDRGEVRVNGNVVGTGIRVQSGDVIELLEPILKTKKVFQQKLDIIYEDDYLAAINKPGGLVVSGNQYRTVENALPFNLKPSSLPDGLRQARPVHRLDAPTSGILLIAKSARAHLSLGQQFENKTIQKIYQAIVMGDIPPSGEINQALEGKEARTHFKRLRQVRSLKNDYLSLVELIPETGRTHQIRKHLAGLGFSILGDKLYSPEGMLFQGKGLLLCAQSIQFLHPMTEERLTLTIELPTKYQTLLDREQRRWERYHD